jgi:ribonucleoside-diphosphate reductase beta chain
LNETLGLEDYEAFLHEPATAKRFENLVAYKGNSKIGIAKSLAVFSAFAEGVSLYSAFAVLYSFQMRNLLKGIGQQMKWSVRDESLHSKMGCQLYRDMCNEDNQLMHLCREDIITAAKDMVALEMEYIDKMFEMGDIEGISSNDLKHFIKKRTNEKLVELGYVDLGNYFAYDDKAAANLDWFYHLTGGVTHTDFFAIRPTDYSKAGEGEDFEDIW